MKPRRALLGILFLLVGATIFARFYRFVPGGDRLVQKIRGRASVEDRLAQYGSGARARLEPYFREANVAYPPHKLVLVGLKEENQLQIYASGADGNLKFIRSYAVLGASGEAGPKLREGDRQVPEGVYRIESLNPNSAFHLALRVNYPSDYDRAQAERENRTNLGGDIMIHGSNGSAGCLAMGDEAAEDIFCLAAEKWPQNIEVLLCPRDLRRNPAPQIANPPWATEIYRELKSKLAELGD